MARHWTIYAPDPVKKDAQKGDDVRNPDWGEIEDAELMQLARGATAAARRSIQQINPAKAASCRKQLLQEMKEAR